MKENYPTKSSNNMLTIYDYSKLIKLQANTVIDKVASNKMSVKENKTFTKKPILFRKMG
ncbi:MAG: hypothetical protein IJ565_01175 [Bacilli bacterium]|nr:hypothetical protein [Bacilli bacterium]